MNISTSASDEFPDLKKDPGGYEWWYFDGLSEDQKWGFVVIFYQGNPFSPSYIMENHGDHPEDYPAISVSIYHEGKAEFYSFQEFRKHDFNSKSKPFSVSVGKNSFTLLEDETELAYQVKLDVELNSGHRLKGCIDMTGKPLHSEFITEESRDDRHKWNLLLPTADFEASFDLKGRTHTGELTFNGKGYHDHNTGNEPMKDSFRDWYWGRFHTKQYSFLYYVMNGNERRQYKGWLINNHTNQVEADFNDATMSDYKSTWLGLRPADSLIFSNGDAVVNIQQGSSVDSGPFYQRYISSMILRTRDNVAAGPGISEYIVPERIYNRRFWWMIHMRLRYMDTDPHWVQNYRRLYEQTW